MTSCCSCRRCLLSDLPAEVLQAVTSHLPFQDYSSLRQVSRSVSKRITQFCVPYITLRLSDGSSTQQVQQWCQTMQGLAAVSNIHMTIAIGVSADVFELAMQLLSQRATPVKELHLLSSHGRGSIPSLQPLQHLLPHLQTLVIKDTQFNYLAIDLKQLAAAAALAGPSPGWQLQTLNLSCTDYCHWTQFTSAIGDLAKAFPNLQQLVLKIPLVGFWLTPAALQPEDPEGLPIIDDQYLVPCLIDHSDVEAYAITHQYLTKAEIVTAAVTGAVAAVAAVANAVLQLKELQMLTVIQTPDIWQPRYRHQRNESLLAPVAIAADIEGTVVQQGAAPLLSLSAAAAAFATLDDFGRWLLQRHPRLKDLKIRTGAATSGGGCCVSWQQTQQLQPTSCVLPPCSSSSGGSSMSLVDISAAASLVDSHNQISPTTSFTCQLSHYSPRPASLLMNSISSLKLKVDVNTVNSLPKILGDLNSLKHLEIHFVGRYFAVGPDHNAATVIVAAAAVTSLQSLTVTCWPKSGGQKLSLADDVLLPLTAAAGGPGSSLTKLVLDGNFGTNAAAAAAAAGSDNDSRWHHSLKQLDGLIDLSVLHASDREPLNVRKQFRFPVESLPASLEEFAGCNLSITCAAGGGGGGDGSDSGSSTRSRLQQGSKAHGNLQLRKLQLTHCQMSSPSVLASTQLQYLLLNDCCWSGGWAAAVGAWPNVNDLACTWSYESSRWPSKNEGRLASTNVTGQLVGSSSSGFAGLAEGSAADPHVSAPSLARSVVEEAMRDMSVGFRCLRCVVMSDLPSLSANTLQQFAGNIKEVRSIAIGVQNEAECYDLSPQCLLAAHTAGADTNATSFSNRNSDEDLGAARRWLQQQMPWATVIVELPWEVVPILP